MPDFVESPISGLILPRHIAKERQHQAQMSKPIVFWYNRKRDFILLPPGPITKAPTGYEAIECRHANEVELWSKRLRAQEKRLREMTDEERFRFEDGVRFDMLQEMRKNLAECTDPRNKRFMQAAIEHFEKQRERARPEHTKVESYMAVEAEEGLAP